MVYESLANEVLEDKVYSVSSTLRRGFKQNNQKLDNIDDRLDNIEDDIIELKGDDYRSR